MATLYDSRTKLLSQVRQPDSALQPKPGLLDAGGNKPTPVLQPNEQQTTQPSITPQADYKPIADPVNSSNNPLSYQEALTQGRLTQGTTAGTPQGGFGGYDPNKAPANYDPRGWAMTSEQVTQPEFYGQIRVQPDGSSVWISPEQYNQEQWTKAGRTGAPPAVGTTLPGLEGPKAGTPFLGEQYSSPESFSKYLETNPLENKANPLTSKLNEQLSKERGSPVTPNITPKGANFSEVAGEKGKGLPMTGGLTPASTNMGIGNQAPTPPSVSGPEGKGDDSLSKIFKFFKGDLERERDVNLSNSDVEAASRGVFYGTPGTQSREDVRDRFGRSLAQLEASLLQNEQQNELSRLGLATNLFGNMQANDIARLQLAGGLIPQDVEAEGIDPNLYTAIAQMFGGKQSAGGVQQAPVPNVSAPRPTLTPNTPQPATTLPTPFAPTSRQTKALSKLGKR